MSQYPRVAKLNNPDKFRGRINELQIDMPFDRSVDPAGALSEPIATKTVGEIGNRFAILPMEGWDGTREGGPTELTQRRWKNFGLSGAKLIWGGEAVAVRHDGRANPNQLCLTQETVGAIAGLRQTLVTHHRDAFGDDSDLSIGLQLTHSGRFARPNDKQELESVTAYAHSVLDQKSAANSDSIISDDDLKLLIEDFVDASKLAESAGFDWIDVKHCHGYLGHELLSGYDRPGEFGGSFENRTRFLREIVAGVRAETRLAMGVRLSIFDFVPFEPGPDGVGVPVQVGPDVRPFGSDATGVDIDLAEPVLFLEQMKSLGIELLCTTAGSPYYNPHIQRPATFPPSDGYQPPEDPLVGVARQIQATASLKQKVPDLLVVGSGYSYLQDWLPHVAQAAVRSGLVDFVGLGRMVLSYPDLPADVLEGRTLTRKKICRTFSDCTTAPRNGMVSGCYPLDGFYKKRPEFEQLRQVKRGRNPNPN